MPNWARILVAVLLVPFCIGAVSALIKVLSATGTSDTLWVALLGGAACWLSIYLLLPKPMRIYVFGHELTHVLWTWMFGGRVRRFKATAKGGHVVISKSNFLIVLAPYFFPLYAVIVGVCFVLGHLLWDWTPYLVWFHLLIGAAYAFHITLTWNALQTRQTDISSQGYFFSAVIVFLGNITVLLLGIPLVSHGKVRLSTALTWWLQEIGAVVRWVGIGS